MKNADEGIERVLAALREAEAPEGMEQRILQSMQKRASARRGWNPLIMFIIRMPSLRIRRQSWAIAVTAVAIVSLAACFTVFQGHRMEHDFADSKKQIAPAYPPAPKVQTAAASALQPLPARSVAHSRDKTNTRKAGAGSNADSVALHAMLAVSYPAPPMPLTEQEKLLLRIAHRRDPVELAMLEPLLRSVQDAEEKAEFQKFFRQSPTKQSAAEQLVPSTAEQAMPGQFMTEQTAPGQPTTEPTTEQLTTDQPKSVQPTTGDIE